MVIENINTYGARRFENKIALVTGGAGGIGAAICARLAAEGATVIIADTAREAAEALAEELNQTGFQAATSVFNLTDAAACAQVIEQVVADHGRIDVLVNNAGINRRGALMELSDSDWDLSFAVNLDALYRLSKLVIPLMQKQGGGAIVNTASQWGIHPAPAHIAYNVTKAAVVSFTKNSARDYAPNKIRVNAIAPGEVLTPMVEANLAKTGRSVADLDALVPFGRVGRPPEIVALVAFLASDEAPYLCGSVVEIAGAQAVAKMSRMLEGKNLVITCASRGIGLEMLKAAHREGASIVAHAGRDAASAALLAEQFGPRVTALAVNLADPTARRDFFASAVAELGHVDVLVNNAGA